MYINDYNMSGGLLTLLGHLNRNLGFPEGV
jgi:hypothetical protein